MKLYVCYTTAELHLRPGGHPCANAHKALKKAGYDPEVEKARGLAQLPGPLKTKTRRLVEENTGSTFVPALETDEGEWIGGSKRIIAWAEAHPAVSQA